MIKPQQAFTLIELMVALALGLLIVAAGLAVFLSSQRSMGLQSSLGGVQQNANFGLSSLTYDLRHANLNTASSQYVNNKVIGSGIIFAKENLPSNLQNITDLETKFVSLQNKDTDNTSGKSDQLTIQYVPAANEIIDCEGNSITSAQSKTIVQRYFLKEINKPTGEPVSYSLACDAGWYATGDTTIIGLNDNVQQVMQYIDAFKVRLGVKKLEDNTLRYMTLDEYKTAMSSFTDPKKYLQVVSIDLGILARSTGKIGSDASLNTQKIFKLAGQTVTLSGTDATNQKYLRQAVNQVVALRNTLGAS
ncbi:PilW family protein [Acinetobacter calcoaceticus]|uniref:PilW family protein n=1 Tax=Acinetobacter calcoaceticus TaxID=471 RepID=UPI00300A3169